MDGDIDDKPPELPIIRHPRLSSRGLIGDHQRPSSHQEEPQVFTPRDPRFDPRCRGTNDLNHFVKNYGFIDDIRRDEIAQMEQAFRKEKDPNMRDKIRSTILRLKSKMVERDNKCKKMELIRELKRGKPDEESHHGKEPSDRLRHMKNIKKSDLKKRLIVNKYKELKESGKLSKYLERKRKKLISRDQKALKH